jgi:transcription elongation GreA/GreB family factor
MSVAFVREDSAAAAQEVSLPPRPISVHANLVPRSGLHALERANAKSQAALKAAQAIEDVNERRRALDLAARDARYFLERLTSALLQPEPARADVVAVGSRAAILCDDGRRLIYRIVGEDEADPRGGSIAYVSPLARGLMGKRIGDIVDTDRSEIEILAIA